VARFFPPGLFGRRSDLACPMAAVTLPAVRGFPPGLRPVKKGVIPMCRVSLRSGLAAPAAFVVATGIGAGGAQATGPEAGAALDVATISVQPIDVPADPGPHAFVEVELDGELVRLSLFRSSVRADGFQVLTPGGGGGLRAIAPPPARTYRGNALELRGSRVAASLAGGRLRALVTTADKAWGIQPLEGKAGELHAVYDAADVLPGPWSCGVDDGAQVAPVREGGDAGASPEGGFDVAEIAFDADFEFFLDNGTVDATVADIENVLNSVNVIYQDDVNITHELTAVIVRNDPDDPYTTNDPSGLLGQFQVEWNQNQQEIQRDVAHLMTGKNLSGSVIGIAGLGGVCSSFQGFGLSQSNFTSNFVSRVGLTAHELGHNWGAPHCNGSNPCNIMCSSLGGCSSNLTSFAPVTQNVINNFKATAGCVNSTPPQGIWLSSVTTDDGDDLVEFGETATVTLTLELMTDPDVEIAGLAATIFDTLGGTNAASGGIAGWQVLNSLADLTGDLTETDGVSLFNTNAGQLTMFGGSFVPGFPIGVLEFKYEPGELDGSLVTYTTETSDLLVWEGPIDDVIDTQVMFVEEGSVEIQLAEAPDCPADCNGDGMLNVLDFTCFQELFAGGDAGADCDGSGTLDIFDFTCFQASFAAGCG